MYSKLVNDHCSGAQTVDTDYVIQKYNHLEIIHPVNSCIIKNPAVFNSLKLNHTRDCLL